MDKWHARECFKIDFFLDRQIIALNATWLLLHYASLQLRNRVLCVCVGGGGGCVCGGCVCLAYTSEDFHMKTPRHTEDSTPSEDPKTGPRKTLAKNAENVMFYNLRGVRAPRTSMDFQPYLIYEDIRVLGSISKASRGVCVCFLLLISSSTSIQSPRFLQITTHFDSV